MPPCRSVLLHAKRARRIAFLWKRALSTTIEEPELLECGWNESGDIQWVTEIYPGTVEEILFEIDEDDNNEIEYGNELKSEDEEECVQDACLNILLKLALCLRKGNCYYSL